MQNFSISLDIRLLLSLISLTQTVHAFHAGGCIHMHTMLEYLNKATLDDAQWQNVQYCNMHNKPYN